MSRSEHVRLAVAMLLIPLLCVIALQACVSKPAVPAEERIVIFHLNDVHGKIDNFAKIAALIDAERKKGSEVFVFSAGDNFTGNPVIDQYDPPGEPILELLNKIGTDLLCVGNHEFDYGLETLRRFASRAQFSFLSANTETAVEIFPQLRPYEILTSKSGLRITVFGLIQIEAGNGLPSTHPDKLKGLSFSEPLKKAMELKDLRKGSHVLIALTHIGYDQDLQLAAQMPELDIIIGGHSHTRINPAELVNGVLIAQAGSDARFLGRVELRLQGGRVIEKKGELVDIKSLSEEVTEVREMINRFNRNPAFEKVFAEASIEISGKDALGSLMTDAMCWVHNLDIAFQNNGGIRLGRLPKKITFKDIYTLDPFNNQVVEIIMTTDEIRSLIRNSMSRGGEIDLQVSGISYVVSVEKDRGISGILLKKPDGRPLPEDGRYKVGVSSYVASSYDFDHQDPGRSLGYTTAEALIRFLESGPDLSIYNTIRRAFSEVPGKQSRN